MDGVTPTPEAIAAKLTKAQREAILAATTVNPDIGGEPFVTVKFTDPWPAPVARFVSLHTDVLTPLGLAVRAILAGEE